MSYKLSTLIIEVIDNPNDNLVFIVKPSPFIHNVCSGLIENQLNLVKKLR